MTILLKGLFSGNKTPGVGEKAKKFQELLKKRDIDMNLDINENGIVSFYVDQNIVNGPVIRAVMLFNEEETSTSLYIFDYLKVDEEKREAVLNLVNSINRDYIYTNFYISEENDVVQKYSFDIEQFYSPEQLLEQLITMVQHAKNHYGNFMKILWT